MVMGKKTSTPTQSGVSRSGLAAYAAVILGITLLVGSGFYVYARIQSGMDAIKFSYSVPVETMGTHLGRTAGRNTTQAVNGSKPIPFELKAPDVAKFANLYPGDQLNPMYWSEPEWAGSESYGGPTIPDDFVPVVSTDLFRDFLPSADATRIRIPSLNIDSKVAELEIVDLGNQRAYQTPDNTVGHIPETSAPGQQGSGWFFAHLQSPIEGGSSIFRHLPEVTELIKKDPVDVYLETDDAEFVYRVTSTKQVHRADLQLTSSEDAQIRLVTCWPPLVYDQRILVDATLIAYRPI